MRKVFRQALSLLLALCLLPLSSAALAEETEGAGLRIAELMVKNKATVRDEDGDFSDWIELENASSRPVSLAGWALSDGGNGAAWPLPERTLQPGERLLVFADKKDRPEPVPHTDFALSEGETLRLLAPDGSTADELVCADCKSDRSLLRTEDGFVECVFPSPGYVDTAAGYNAWQESLTPLGPLCIAEVSVYETEARFGTYYGCCDWVEIRNLSDETVSLGGWTLSDDSTDCVLPDYALSPGRSLLLRCSETPALSPHAADFGTGFSLSSESDRLFLRSPDGQLVDWAALRGIPFGASFGRDPQRGGWCFFASPSPGKDNSGGVRRVSAAPVSDGPDGVFDGVESVSVSLRADGEIHYTLDSSLPTAQSPLYEGPLCFAETTMLRAVAVERDALPSRPLNLSYFLNEGHTLPVVSLVADSPAQFRRMYSGSYPVPIITANVAWYDGDARFSLPCEVRLNGETSRVLTKKNLALRFRGVYGAEALDFDCFGGGVTHFTNLLLRSGQNYSGAVMKNELGCAMADAATDAVMVQRFRYCVLYLNGSYNGIYALMEKTNEQMAADLLGVSKDSVTVIEASASPHSAFYQEVYEPAVSRDLRNEDNYRAVCEALDIDSLIDWTIIEGWCCNKDLQSGNVRYVRSTETDGKWRVMLYDLDATFGGQEYCFDILTPYSLSSRQIGMLLGALLKNPDFRDRFLTRAAELLSGPLSDEAFLREIDLLEEQLAPEIPRNHAMLGLIASAWPGNVDKLRALCDGPGWAQTCVNMLCYRLRIGSEERERYFGALS